MLEPLLALPEPSIEPFLGQVVERSHVPSEPDTVDALLVTNDRDVEQDAMDDGTGVVELDRLRTEEVGINIGMPSLRTSLAKGDFRAATDIDDNQREGGGAMMDIYLNVINSIETDSSNKAYGLLLEKDEDVNKLIHISEVFDFEEDNDEIGDIDDPLFNGSLKEQEVALDVDEGGRGVDVPSVTPTQIYGSDSMRRRLGERCVEYADIFSRSVKKDPASVSAMKLDVDKTEWERPFNRLPARPQSSANQDEIRKQLSKMLDLGVIAPRRSTNWSQMSLAAKSNGG
jgi:hypothetical protein